MECHFMSTSTLAWGKFDIRAQLGRRWDSQRFNGVSPCGHYIIRCTSLLRSNWRFSGTKLIAPYPFVAFFDWDFIDLRDRNLTHLKKPMDRGLAMIGRVISCWFLEAARSGVRFAEQNRYSLFGCWNLGISWYDMVHHGISGSYVGNDLGKTQRDPTAKISKATVFFPWAAKVSHAYFLAACLWALSSS